MAYHLVLRGSYQDNIQEQATQAFQSRSLRKGAQYEDEGIGGDDESPGLDSCLPCLMI
jgi:hypothetical protein